MRLILGDSGVELKKLSDSSVDAIVTDPPYGISFMAKKWDYDVPSIELWKECLRVLKPGGHILCACGTRTQHRMAVNIEDAGFEIRDIVGWVYGSGFPKSLNIGKAVDRFQGNEREATGKRHRNVKPYDDNNGWNQNDTKGDFTYTKGSSPHEGWGTALKPAMELWTLARKPLSEKTIAQNVLKHGTGGINIDGCRVGSETRVNEFSGNKETGMTACDTRTDSGKGLYSGKKEGSTEVQGRFPANLIHDGSDEVVDIMGEPQRFFYCAKASKSERNKGLDKDEQITDDGRQKKIDNPYLRGKTLRKNNHPTVKPIKLMQYLCRLITPKNGIVLDPFMGSGTTGIACKLEGFDFIGIEREKEYVEISKARIKSWQKDRTLFDE